MSCLRALSLGALLPVSLALAQPSGSPGSLRGSVTDPQGLPLAGAEVRDLSVAPPGAAGRGPAPAQGETVVNGSVPADATGGFALTGLPAAAYLLCASVPSAPYLDPCTWGQAVRTAVSAGATTNQNLVLEKGVYLNVRVNDPVALLPQVIDGPWTPRKLLAGVAYGSGAYEGAPNIAVDSTGRNYQLIIPAGVPFSLWLYSTDVALADATGRAVAAPAAGIPFQASAGQDQTFKFTVLGPASHAQ